MSPGFPSAEMQTLIGAELERLRQDRHIKLLLAAESGSRAWGFASENSDYDVRFIYVNRLEWYLHLGKPRDVIERMLPRDIDLSGWELRKALGLMHRYNAPLCEWLDSPIFRRCRAAYRASRYLRPPFLHRGVFRFSGCSYVSAQPIAAAPAIALCAT
jgi:uncharacterized protein